jgi:glycosyltransferase involved in cell wall biosynthesis
MPSRVSGVIPTKNVAGFIRPTLDSLRFCDEVVIVDMFSTDDTRAVCESYANVKFYQRQDYIYGNFNYGAEQATGDWILRLDSDEVVSPALRESILNVLDNPSPAFLHYDAVYHMYFLGQRLRHGYGTGWRTTLFRRGTARYPVKGEHEGLKVSGPAGRLDGHYDHVTNPTLSTWVGKLNYYTDRDAERMNPPAPVHRLRLVYMTLRNFQRVYFGRNGFYKDGYLGFVVASLSAFSLFLQYCKMWERSLLEEEREPNLIRAEQEALAEEAEPCYPR